MHTGSTVLFLVCIGINRANLSVTDTLYYPSKMRLCQNCAYLLSIHHPAGHTYLKLTEVLVLLEVYSVLEL